MKKDLFGSWQRKIFMLCWGAYTLAYLGRINLSIAIPIMEQGSLLDKTNIGVIGSAFFWVYAFGQLINGRLGDKLNSRYFVFIGLLVSSVINILFGFSVGVLVMTLLWAVNGYFQSILWGPLLRILYRWFPEQQRPAVGLYIFTSVLAGFLLTWGVLSQTLQYIGWQGAFILPGIILFAYALLWLGYARNTPEEIGMSLKDAQTGAVQGVPKPYAQQDEVTTAPSYWNLIFKSKLYVVALSSIPLGFIREGITLWGPTLLFETYSLTLQSTMQAALIIPFFNLLGIIAARTLITKFLSRQTRLVAIFFAVAACCCILLYFLKDIPLIVFVSLLAICSLCLYGGTAILTSVIPFDYTASSSVAGFIDFSIYLGAGLSGVVTGWASQVFGWDTVLFLWVVLGVLGTLCISIAGNSKVEQPL